MTVQERGRLCRLIDQMEQRQALSIRLCLENKSTFHGCPIHEYQKKKRGNET